MPASLDRQAFFAAVRKAPFGGSLTPSQAEGIGVVLDLAPAEMLTSALAYCFATAFHETGRKMQPTAENLNYSSAARIRAVWPSRFPTLASAEPYVRNPRALANKVYGGRLGNTGPDDGWTYRGMGLVQATGKDNARRCTTRLRALGYIRPGDDLVATPEMMLTEPTAAAMLFVGLTDGWYTGKKLSDFFGPPGSGRENPIAARAMVNPDGNGPLIATYHSAFKAALVAAGHNPGPPGSVIVATAPPAVAAQVTSGAPIPPVPVNTGAPDIKPVVEAAARAAEAAYPPPVAGPAKTGALVAWLKSWFGKAA
ncbi:hypothetical protein [Methylobacterium sp. WSM2598]|uniref:hypothetical protein n=1 Tax=Methylobacterium sp. WSM2598 TaxID=398261 RepID=UPI0003749BFF|nr:hypothetical protein [Methylobacterium sp. WSM2598]